MGRRRALHHRGQQAEVPQLLQDASRTDDAGELRRTQRLAHPDSRPRGHGAGWYQGGVSVFDWTDVEHPKEIAYFDRGRSTPPASSAAAPGPPTGQRRHRQLRDRAASTSTSSCRAVSSPRTSSTPPGP
jgi:hypothetical protein